MLTCFKHLYTDNTDKNIHTPCIIKYTNETLTIEENMCKWKQHILRELKQYDNCFAEFEISNNKTVVGQYSYEFVKTIKKNELIKLIKQVCNELNYKFCITTRSIYDTSSSHYIVLSIIT